MEVGLVGLRVLREVAEQGTFTAAARSLGYTQSAVSRQVAALEQAIGRPLFERHRSGVQLTSAGHALLRHAAVALDAIDAARAELSGDGRRPLPFRLGVTPVAAASLLPGTLARVQRRAPHASVSTRDGTTGSLLRALRAGTLDAALLTSRPPHRAPDGDSPPLRVEPLLDTHLCLALSSTGRFAGRSEVDVGELTGEAWIASSATADDPVLGVWPGLPGRPRVVHLSRDWLVKLQLVAAGAGVTTVPATMGVVIPEGVRLARVRGVPDELRRVSWVCLPGPAGEAATLLLDALRDQVAQLPGAGPTGTSGAFEASVQPGRALSREAPDLGAR